MSVIIKELNKTYEEKTGTGVHALKDVTFTLPDKGLVFILGKSGCGKTTLLNVISGLDSFDSGEIIIDGKSTKNFSIKETDNFRNNYVGFVAQDRNLLDDYTVRRNVGLAFDLQGIKNYDEQIDEALKSVELEGYGERKCNRLSGGQKQRVAIARVLVKKPKLLLCDEPTGSLDSETGDGIFKLLKNISEDTLVVVVTHDQESAEKYGDRIIRLKDGAVVSDSAPESEDNHKDNTVASFSEQKYVGLTIKRSFGLAISFLIAKPIRMVLCIIVCLVSMTCIGVADIFSAYDRAEAVVETMSLYKTSHLSFIKKNTIDYFGEVVPSERDYNNDWLTRIAISNLDINVLKPYVNSDRLDVKYDISMMSGDSSNLSIHINEVPIEYVYKDKFECFEINFNDVSNCFNVSGFVELDKNLPADYGFTLYGDYPNSYDEIVITDLLFNGIKKYGYVEGGATQFCYMTSEEYADFLDKIIYIESRDEIIGKILTIEGNIFKVVGVLDTQMNEDLYGEYLYNNDLSLSQQLKSSLLELNAYGMHNAVYLAKGYYDSVYYPTLVNLFPATGSVFDKDPNNNVVSFVAPNTGNRSMLIDNAHVYKQAKLNGSDNCVFDLVNEATTIVGFSQRDMLMLARIFLYIGIGLIVLAVLFVMIFISGVITDKKREIGILREMGASRGDILKIFCVQNGIFAIILITLSSLSTSIGGIIMNQKVTMGFGMKGVTLLSFGIRQFAVILGVTLIAVILGVAIPIIKALHDKPVDITSGRK